MREREHQCNVFINFIRFDVMLIYFMDIFSSSEDFGVGLFHFTLEFLTLFGAVEEGFHEGGTIGWRGSMDCRECREGTELDSLKWRSNEGCLGCELSIHHQTGPRQLMIGNFPWGANRP